MHAQYALQQNANQYRNTALRMTQASYPSDRECASVFLHTLRPSWYSLPPSRGHLPGAEKSQSPCLELARGWRTKDQPNLVRTDRHARLFFRSAPPTAPALDPDHQKDCLLTWVTAPAHVSCPGSTRQYPWNG